MIRSTSDTAPSSPNETESPTPSTSTNPLPSHPIDLTTSPTPNSLPSRASTSKSRRRKKQREMIVVPSSTPRVQGAPNSTQSIPSLSSQLSPTLPPPTDVATPTTPRFEEPPFSHLAPVNLDHGPTTNVANLPVAEGGQNSKLPKWLSRSRSKSVGAQEALSGAAPTISISASASVQSNLVVENGRPVNEEPTPRPSTSSIVTENGSDGHRTKSGSGSSFPSLSLRTAKRGSRPVEEEVLDEWASGSLDDEDAARGEENGRRVVGKPSKGTRFSLRKTKSNLRLFNRTELATAEEPVDGTTTVDNPNLPYGRSSNAKSRSSTSLLEIRSSNSARSQTVTRPASFSQLNQSQNSPNNVAGRIGGWFSSMLQPSNGVPVAAKSPSLTHLPFPGPNEPNSSSHSTTPPNSSYFQSINASSPSSDLPHLHSPQSKPHRGSPFLPSSSSPPPLAAGTGRLGPLDRMLDKAVQYFLDTDSAADKCEDDIWVLGVRHPGYSPPPPAAANPPSPLNPVDEDGGQPAERQTLHRKKKSLSLGLGKMKGVGRDKRRESTDDSQGERRSSAASSIPPLPTTLSGEYEHIATTPSSAASSTRTSPKVSPQPSFQNSTTSPTPFHFPSAPLAISTNVGSASSVPLPPNARTQGWPTEFYLDFYSRMALTYRTGFPPIPCSPSTGPGGMHGMFNSLSLSIGRGGGSGSRTAEGLSSDTGWGCMLRTGQSLLANTLMTVHLGRDWRRPLPSVSPNSPSPNLLFHATYARIISLFIDDPSLLSPFSVHRFALMGKQLGKEVGEWFGPSTAAGAIKALVNSFPPAGLQVYSVLDGTVYKSEVENASRGEGVGQGKSWSKPVLVLIGLRLGIDGVNPIYHEGIKAIFRFPQSVGIAGGRPSSSYYFVGSQANSLFYIDPHHPRPSIHLRFPPSDLFAAAQTVPLASTSTPTFSFKPTRAASPASNVTEPFTINPSPTTPHAPISPPRPTTSLPLTSDRLGDWFVDSYPDSVLKTYHCDKVRKMALSSLDPSMLVGFLIQDEDDWNDFEARVKQVAVDHKAIFSTADAPPLWMKRGTPSPGKPNGNKARTSAADSDDDISDIDDVDVDDWELDSTNASGLSVNSPPPTTPPLSNLPLSNGQTGPRDEDERGLEGGDRDEPDSASAHQGFESLTPRSLQVLSMSTPDDSLGGPPSWCTASEPPSSAEHLPLPEAVENNSHSQMQVVSEEEGEGPTLDDQREEEGGMVVVPQVVVGGTGILVDRRETLRKGTEGGAKE